MPTATHPPPTARRPKKRTRPVDPEKLAAQMVGRYVDQTATLIGLLEENEIVSTDRLIRALSRRDATSKAAVRQRGGNAQRGN